MTLLQEAVLTESWLETPAKSLLCAEEAKIRHLGPYEVQRLPSGRHLLTRNKPVGGAPNSTMVALRCCEFKDCGAAFGGGTDGLYFRDLVYRSRRQQSMPVFSVNTEVEFTDVDIVANLPPGCPFAWSCHKVDSVTFLQGYRAQVARDGVLHGYNAHGPQRTDRKGRQIGERRSDQIPISQDDLDRIGQIVAACDSAKLGSFRQTTMIQLTKKFDDGLITTAWSVSHHNMAITFADIWKRP